MIVTVCSDKGSPGATTLATVLGVVWPGERLLMECDPAGADLPFRMRHGDSGEPLTPEPSVIAVAAAARASAEDVVLERFAQATSLGVPVIPGVLTAERAVPLRSLWPQIARVAAGWGGTVLADVGRLQPGSPLLPVAQASAVVVLVASPSLESFYHLRERVADLVQVLGDPGRVATSLRVVIAGPAARRTETTREAQELLTSIGSPAPMAGYLVMDPAGCEALWAGQLTRRLMKSPLLRSATEIANTLLTHISQLTPVAAGAGEVQS